RVLLRLPARISTASAQATVPAEWGFLFRGYWELSAPVWGFLSPDYCELSAPVGGFAHEEPQAERRPQPRERTSEVCSWVAPRWITHSTTTGRLAVTPRTHCQLSCVDLAYG